MHENVNKNPLLTDLLIYPDYAILGILRNILIYKKTIVGRIEFLQNKKN
jgi:hypothetical protein